MNFLLQTGPGIGDILQILPMASAIKSQYPDANVDLIIPSSPSKIETANQVIQCQNYVRNLYWYNVDYKFHCAALLFRLRMNHYDSGFVRDGGMIVNSAKPSIWIFRIMRWGGVKKIAGFVKNQVDIFADVPEFSHFTEYSRRVLKAAGINAEMTFKTIDTSKLDFSFENYDRLKDSGKVIALSTGTNECYWNINGKRTAYDVKSWGYEKWLELAARLSGEGYDVVLLGGNKERKEISAKNLVVPENGRIFDFIGRTSIKQSLALLSLCRLAVGAEGGMMHCAAGLGVKTLTVFGGSDCRKWTPVGGEILTLGLDCQPCFSSQRAPECQYHKCLEGINVDMVFGKVMTIMNK
ncbi:MAG: glycosyltransferase family 9 protein [Synergistaceae bacterium]|nr:glycosyltransferase family 9 protein [Synergistaceae bacterium]